jgi:GNAT superfamily N-acetyltransferase
MSDMVVRPFDGASPTDRDALVALFAAAGSSCFCRYWHFVGDKNDWQARIAFEPGTSEAELRAAGIAGADDARGVVALLGGVAIGWMKVAPSRAVAKLYEQRFYRGLASLGGDRDGVWAIGCSLVHPDHRGGRVSHHLARGAVEAARTWGARALEAFPRLVDARVSDEELWMGPVSAYREAGFDLVEDSRPYPVLRAILR